MVTTAADLAAAGIDAPLLVGGAALSPAFTWRRIAPAYRGPVAYARDAMHGLDLANRFGDPARRPALLAETGQREGAESQAPGGGGARPPRAGPATRPGVRRDVPSSRAAPLGGSVLPAVPLDLVWPLPEPPDALREAPRAPRARGAPRRRPATPGVPDARSRWSRRRSGSCRAGGMTVSAVYRWFPVRGGRGGACGCWTPGGGAPLASFRFPARPAARGSRSPTTSSPPPARPTTSASS